MTRIIAWLAALLAIGFILAVATYYATMPANAASCPAEKQFTESEAYIHGEVETGKATGLIVLTSTEDVDALLTHINQSYGQAIPLGKADHAIGYVHTASGKFVLFGYLDGCQVGYLVMNGTPDLKPVAGEDA